MDKSCYERIREAAADGALPEDFRMAKAPEGGLSFADGALDGITLYHRAPGHELSEAQKALIARAIQQISDGDFYDAEETVWQIAGEIGALDAHGDLQRCICENAQSLQLGNIVNFAFALATQSPNPAVVKLVLSMLSPFSLGEDGKEVIRTLGLSDEFTLFAAINMQSWDNSNNEWFNLARRVRGWGRIHLIDRLQPQTEEIRRWLLVEGVHNTVMPAYSALDCWMKADVPAVLKGVPDKQALNGVRDILLGLLDEGPVRGISAIEDAEAHILAFLEREGATALDDEDRSAIADIREHFSENMAILHACDALL